MRHHVAFVINNYPPHTGGVERHVQSLANGLVARGHRVTVVTLSDDPGIATEHGVDVIRLRKRLAVGSVLAFPLPGTGRRLRRLFRDRSVTAVSVHTRFFPMTWLGVAAARCVGAPVVHTEHGSGFVRGVSPVIAIASRMVDLTFGRWALRRATVVLAVSDAVAGFVRRLSGVEAEIFPAAVDLERWFAARAGDAAAPEGARFVFLGRMVPGKGWDDLLDAALRLRAQGREFTVQFIGDGPDLPQLRERIEQADATAFATARGHLEGDDLVDALRGAVLVNPTTLAEGFQTSLLEALAAGGSVLTYDVPGASTLHEEGAPVRIIAPDVDHLADAMAEAVDRPAPAYLQQQLKPWGWVARSAEYERVLNRVRVTE